MCFNVPLDDQGQPEVPEEQPEKGREVSEALPEEALIAKTSEAVRRAEEEAAELHNEMDARLAEIEKKAKSAKQSFAKSGVKAEHRVGSGGVEPGGQRGLGIGMAVAMSILGLPIAGFFIGVFIEMNGGSDQVKVWLGLGGAIAGIAHGAWLAQKLSK